jgi:hypothetical protein
VKSGQHTALCNLENSSAPQRRNAGVAAQSPSERGPIKRPICAEKQPAGRSVAVRIDWVFVLERIENSEIALAHNLSCAPFRRVRRIPGFLPPTS